MKETTTNYLSGTQRWPKTQALVQNNITFNVKRTKKQRRGCKRCLQGFQTNGEKAHSISIYMGRTGNCKSLFGDGKISDCTVQEDTLSLHLSKVNYCKCFSSKFRCSDGVIGIDVSRSENRCRNHYTESGLPNIKRSSDLLINHYVTSSSSSSSSSFSLRLADLSLCVHNSSRSLAVVYCVERRSYDTPKKEERQDKQSNCFQ